jgi:2',3'-cyclic-nucleotide 2'-phosphodiesterase (5'-nucleotidase family)
MIKTATIIHTADLHGRLQEVADAILRLKTSHPNSVLVDSGDAVKSGNLGYIPGDRTLEIMSNLGYHAMALGNRETHVWREVMALKLAQARFHLLCANLNTPENLPVLPHITSSVAGVNIAFTGLTVPMVTRKMWTKRLCNILFEDPLETARTLIPQIRQQADVVVVLSHLGLKADTALAEQVGGIDLILGGHSHVETHTPVVINTTVIAHPGAWARYATLATIRLSSSGEREISTRLVPLKNPESKADTRGPAKTTSKISLS